MNTKAVDMLTQEQIAKIASGVTGDAYVAVKKKEEYISEQNGERKGYYRNIVATNDATQKEWNPKFYNSYNGDSLAVILWLMQKIKAMENGYDQAALYCKAGKLVANKDIDALHQMIWERIDQC